MFSKNVRTATVRSTTLFLSIESGVAAMSVETPDATFPMKI